MTHGRKSALALAALSLALCGSNASAQASPDYLLLCKGGNNGLEMHALSRADLMQEVIGQNQRLPSNPLAYAGDPRFAEETATRVTVTFTRAPGAASSGLTTGQCAWSDRGVRAEEPNRLEFTFPGAWFVVREASSTRARAKGLLAQNSVTYETRGKSDQAAMLMSLLNAVRGGGTFQVYAHNDGKGALVVARLGP